jgi:putative acetyltransferase
MIVVAEERREDHDAVAALHRAAFGGNDEADLVERLRQEGVVAASLVALDDEVIIGHILFSDLAVEVDGRAISAVSLAPMAVRPDRQRRGIGSRLVVRGLSCVAERQRAAVIVLGHAGYYARFGFSAELARKLRAPFRGDSFMALELVPGALTGRAGTVRYPPAFRLGAGHP